MAEDRSIGGEGGAGYQVLARKWRPQTFADLIGQEALVRTLRNAFESDRIAHAFILTGVRGVGKTTTARIVAKGLNCVGRDGTGGPTISPCGVCEPCRAIAESRHVDVLEMDAASRTGVDDVREIVESVRYRAASARYKVYIVDEVHMLSTNAFNALLKTLEEPPTHVKFIFATTEIKKVPVTVLSRCQRFDLRRIEPETLIAHLRRICDAEGAAVTDEALALIARAAEGSARDALSLLDQAIAHGAGEADAEAVRAMLGLADRGRALDLFEAVMRGDAAAALDEFRDQHAQGADPEAVLRELAEIAHWISIAKIRAEAADDPTEGPDARARAKALAEGLGHRALSRAWQMLLKALEEVAAAPNPAAAAEMALIRLTLVSELPSPEELIRRLGAEGGPGPPGGAGPGRAGGGGAPSAAPGSPKGMAADAGAAGPGRSAAAGARALLREAPRAAPAPGTREEAAPRPATAEAAPASLAAYATFEDVVALISAKRDAKLLAEVERFVRLVAYAPGRIEFAPVEGAPPALAADLGRRLSDWTGARWMVSVVSGGGASTLAETRRAEADALEARLREHPLVVAALAAFPGAELSVAPAASADAAGAAPEEPPEEEDWADWEPVDPYDDD